MKKSISTWSFYGDWSFEEKLQLAKDAGFEGFEPELGLGARHADGTFFRELAAVRETADRIGITLSGLATGLYWGANAASKNPDTRARAVCSPSAGVLSSSPGCWLCAWRAISSALSGSTSAASR